MADSVRVVVDDRAKFWLTSTVALRCSFATLADPGHARQEALIKAVGAALPSCYIERSEYMIALDFRLPDPSDQFARNDTFLALERAIVAAGFEAHLIELVPWVLLSAMGAIAPRRDAEGHKASFEAREEAVRSASLRPLGPFLADPRRHGISGSGAGFRAYHLELSPIERYIVRKFSDAPKTRPLQVPLTNQTTPYPEADLRAAALELASAGWIKGLQNGITTLPGWHPLNTSLSAQRSRLLSGLDKDTLLSDLF